MNAAELPDPIEDLEVLIYLRAADMVAQWECADPRDAWRYTGEQPPRAIVDPITTAIVSTEHFETQATSAAAKPKKDKLPALPKAALHALFECIADEGQPSPDTTGHAPKGVTCVTLDQWRDRLLKLAIINAKGNHREQFKRIRVTLQNARIIGIWEDFVWPVT
jgi:hypothetical protein